jgi:mannose-1-phosphate guanylyltransferase
MAAWFSDRADGSGVVPLDGLVDLYAALPARAIDYALLEPASMEGRVAVVPAAVGWSDLGSWAALRDHRGGAGASIVTAEGHAGVVEVGSSSVFVHAGSGRTVAVVGLEDVVIVDTPDALLVSRADASQDVRLVVERLREEGRDELL